MSAIQYPYESSQRLYITDFTFSCHFISNNIDFQIMIPITMCKKKKNIEINLFLSLKAKTV